VRLEPFHLTTEPLTKPLPLTVKVNDDPPLRVDDGLRLVIVGAGLLVVNAKAFDVPPPEEAL
jgi:hypothetical protein